MAFAVLGLLARLGILDEDFLGLAGFGVCVLVSESDSGLDLVDVLTAGTAGTEEIPRDF